MRSRYSWKQMPEEYNANYYNDLDYKEGRRFIIIDNVTGKEYVYPQIKVKISESGRSYDQRVIDLDLWNENFIQWAICTSPDFVKYIGNAWFNDRVLNYIVDNYEFPIIFSYDNLTNYMTMHLWNKAFQRNNEVVRYIPKEYMTSEMMEAISNLKNIEWYNLNYSRLTPKLFEKIYFNCDEEHKKELIPFDRHIDPSRIQWLITKDVAEDILSIDIRAIRLIPEQFISEENAIKAMEYNIKFIQYVPKQYQTLEYQKKLIDKNPVHISFIDPTVLTDETIYYALSKRGSVLGGIPTERRTFEICEFAVNNSALALKNVPDEIKNTQMCFNAVVKEPKMIKYVPIELLTKDFVEALNSTQVVIPMQFASYVENCLKAHSKLENEPITLDSKPNIKINIDDNADYSNIKLELLQGLFSDSVLIYLINHGVTTVGSLLEKSQNQEFYSMILNESTHAYREITKAIKLLKCKYLDIDPLIDFDSDKTMEELSEELGFSTRVKNCLRRAGYTPNSFYELMHDETREEKLLSIKNLGTNGVKEILFKTSILLDYYDNCKKREETLKEDETLEALNAELAQVRAEIQNLNARTEEILAKIQQKMLSEQKGGVLK